VIKILSKADVPFYEECKFGYYEWFVRRNAKELVIKKLAVLAPYKIIISDKSYDLEIKYSPELKNKDEYLSRMEAYEIVRRYWKDDNLLNYLKYLKISES